MQKRFTLVFIGTALAAMPCRPAVGQNECSTGGYYPPPVAQNEYSNGGNCKKGRKAATMTPVEAFGVHPPGPDPADLHRCVFCWWKYTYIPYYSPLAPIATSIRWKPWCYFPLLPYYTPYYIGYCPHRLCCPKPEPYGSNGWGDGPQPDHPIPEVKDVAPLRYGPYTSIITDDTVFWNMGGNGLVPYGTPRPPHSGTPDLVDAIQISRQQGGGGCFLAPNGNVPMIPGPAILPPAEKAVEGGNNEAPPAQKSAPPE